MIEVTVLGVRDMVVNVDPECGLAGCVEGIISEARFGGAVQGDGDLNIEWLSGWRLDFITAGEEGQVIGGAVLVDVVHGFAHLLESVAEGDLGADGVTVRSDVTEDDEGIVGADGVSYFLKGVVFTHTDGTFA